MKAKKLLSLFLALVMTLSMCSVTAFADTPDNPDAVAEISGVGYATLEEAIAAAQDGDTVKLVASVTEKVTISGKTLTLDLNGFNITSTTKNMPITADNGTKLTIINSNTNKAENTATQNAIMGPSGGDNYGSLNAKGSETTVDIYAGYYYGYNGNKTAINAINGATITFYGGTVNGAQGVNDTTSGKEGKVFYSGVSNPTKPYATTPGTIIVHGGYFAGRMSDSNWGNYVIDGGTFDRNEVVLNENPVDTNGDRVATASSSMTSTGTGTFADAGWLADGYEATDNGNGTWTVGAAGVAQIGDMKYATLAEAVAAVPTDGTETTITMIADEELSSGVTVAAGKNIVLDLNGYTISGNSNAAATYAVITNRGTLTIQDNTDTNANGTGTGKITALVTTPDQGDIPGYASNVITNNGVLTINSGLIENTTVNGYAAYTVDNITNGTGYTPVFTMNGGRLYNKYTDAVRLFLNSDSKLNKVVINGGVLDSDKESGRVIVFQNSNAKLNKGELDITGGTINGTISAWSGANNTYQFTDAQYTEIAINISGGNIDKLDFSEYMTNESLRAQALQVTGGTYDVDPSTYVTEGYEAVDNNNGTWTVLPEAAAVIGAARYATLEGAIAAAQDGDTVTLLTDVNVGATVAISKSITLDGGNHTLTTTATRGIWIDHSDVTVTIQNLEIVSSNNKMERSIQINTDCDGVTLNLNSITSTATYYTVNICGSVDGLELNINNCDLTGWGVINLWGNNGTVNVSNSTLVGINDKSYNANGWNDFGVIILEGDTTGQTDEHSTAYDVTVTNCNITATSTTGNTQYVLLHNNPSAYNSLALDLCTITLGTNCAFYCDDAVESVTKIKDTFISGTNNVPTLPEGYVYAPIADNYQLITQAVAEVNGVGYPTLAAAIAAANSGDTVELLADVESANGYVINKTISIDTNGKTITVITGANVNNRAFKITSGTLTVYGGGTIVAAGSGTTSSNGTGCYGAFRVEANGKLVASNITLNNSRPWGLNVKVLGGEAELTNVAIHSSYGGGIEVTEADLGTHSKAGTATLNNCTFTQENYYDHCSTAISVSGGSEVIVNGGSYTGEYALYVFSSGGVITVNGGSFVGRGNNNRAAIIAAIDTKTYPEYTGGLQLKGGNYTGTLNITSPAYMSVTGGTFDHDPTDYVAPGYEAVKINNTTWQVGEVKASAIAPAEVADGYEATYTASKQVVDGNDVLATSDTITVNVKTVINNTNSDVSLSKVEIQDVLDSVMAAATVAENDIVNVEIEIVSTAADTTATTVTYEVHPEATIIVNGGEAQTVQIGNEDLAKNASFTITLPVPDKLMEGNTNGQVKVTHKSKGYADEVSAYAVQGGPGNYYVTLTVTHFSEFELAAIDTIVAPNAKVDATLSLEDEILINLYIRNLRTRAGTAEPDPSRFKLVYTFNNEQQTVYMTSASENHFVVARCAATELTKNVHLALYYDDELLYEGDYSASTYCLNKISDNDDANLAKLCGALLTYGGQAQYYLNQNLHDIASAPDYSHSEYNIPETFRKVFSSAGVSSVIANYDLRASLSLEAKTQINVYFQPISGCEYEVYANGSKVSYTTLTEGGIDLIYVAISGIASKQLANDVQITIKNLTHDCEYSFEYSPMTWAYNRYNATNLKPYEQELCLALYNYYLAADVYFD